MLSVECPSSVGIWYTACVTFQNRLRLEEQMSVPFGSHECRRETAEESSCNL